MTIDDHRVILCLGSGGVGKTTVAAALGVSLARRGHRVVVLTIDPAHRLADALGGTTELTNDAQRLETYGNGGELWATMLDQAETFETVIREEARSADQAERILANPLFRNLTRSLSGTNEYMAAERLHQLHGDDRFDRVIVDTPPSRHALDFLDSPGRLSRFVNHRLYRTVFAPRGVLRSVSMGGQIVLRLLGRIVGSGLVEDVVTFFADFDGLDAGFDQRARRIEEILATDTKFVLVAAPRRRSLDEAGWIAANVTSRVGPIDALVVNRTCPITTSGTAIDSEYPPVASEDDPLIENLRELSHLVDSEARLLDRFVDSLDGLPQVVTIAERALPVSDLAALGALASELDHIP